MKILSNKKIQLRIHKFLVTLQIKKKLSKKNKTKRKNWKQRKIKNNHQVRYKKLLFRKKKKLKNKLGTKLGKGSTAK